MDHAKQLLKVVVLIVLGALCACVQKENPSKTPCVTCPAVVPVVGSILVSKPDAQSAAWVTGHWGDTIAWDSAMGTPGDSVEIRLYSDTFAVPFLTSKVPNTGLFVTQEALDPSILPDSGYRIQIIDRAGHTGWSCLFAISRDPFAAIQVTSPGKTSTFLHGQYINSIKWYPDVRVTDSVSIVLFKGIDSIATIASSANYAAEYTSVYNIANSFTPGSDYYIRVKDRVKGLYGWSKPFTIAKALGNRIENVTLVNGAIVQQTQEELAVTWKPLGENTKMSIQLYRGGQLFEVLKDAENDDGAYTFKGIFRTNWSPDSTYTINVVDIRGFYGVSDQFTIKNDSTTTFLLTEPSYRTSWRHRQNVEIVKLEGALDSLRFDLYYNDTLFVNDFGGGLFAPDTVCSLKVFIPQTWNTTGSYRLKGIDTKGRVAYGSNFSIGAYVPTRFAISYPDSNTRWFGKATRPWVVIADTSIRKAKVELYNDYFSQGEIIPLGTVNDSGILRGPQLLSAGYTKGISYKVRVTDSLGNYGESQPFAYIPDTLDRVTATCRDTLYLNDSAFTVSWDSTLGTAHCYLYKGSQLVAQLDTADVGVGAKTFTLQGPFPAAWGTGTGYSIKIVDSAKRYGYTSSITFIADQLEKFTVTVSTTGTAWDSSTRTGSVSFSGRADSSVTLVLYRGTTLVDTLCKEAHFNSSDSLFNATGKVGIDSTDTIFKSSSNVYRYVKKFTSLQPGVWGTGSEFRVKVIGSAGYFGWSAPFSIWRKIG